MHGGETEAANAMAYAANSALPIDSDREQAEHPARTRGDSRLANAAQINSPVVNEIKTLHACSSKPSDSRRHDLPVETSEMLSKMLKRRCSDPFRPRAEISGRKRRLSRGKKPARGAIPYNCGCETWPNAARTSNSARGVIAGSRQVATSSACTERHESPAH